MKVALCLSGLIRDFASSGYSYAKYLAEPLDAVVFIHTWSTVVDTPQSRFLSLMSLQAMAEKQKFFEKIFPANEVHLLEEEQHTHLPSSPRTSALMYYSIHHANKLKKAYEEGHNFEFDMVIRSRMDFLFAEELPAPELAQFSGHRERPPENQILVGMNLTHKGPNASRNEFLIGHGVVFVDDQFAFGTSKSMDIYSNVYPDVSGLATRGGEVVLGQQLSAHQVTPIHSKFKYEALQFIDKECSTYWCDYDDYSHTTKLTRKHLENIK